MWQVARLCWKFIWQNNWFHCQKQTWENNLWQIMYSMDKISSPAHAKPAIRSWVPWLYSLFGCFAHWFAERQRAAHYRWIPPGVCVALDGYVWSRDAKFPHWIQNSYSAGGSEQTSGAHNLSGKEKEGWNVSEEPKSGSLLLVRRTRFIQAVLWHLDCMINTTRTVFLLPSNVSCLNPCHCVSSSVLHSCKHHTDCKIQY